MIYNMDGKLHVKVINFYDSACKMEFYTTAEIWKFTIPNNQWTYFLASLGVVIIQLLCELLHAIYNN